MPVKLKSPGTPLALLAPGFTVKFTDDDGSVLVNVTVSPSVEFHSDFVDPSSACPMTVPLIVLVRVASVTTISWSGSPTASVTAWLSGAYPGFVTTSAYVVGGSELSTHEPAGVALPSLVQLTLPPDSALVLCNVTVAPSSAAAVPSACTTNVALTVLAVITMSGTGASPPVAPTATPFCAALP